ncbi:DUF1353 domain-containing protein [Hymenobacter setariae]|uniref:DUF1353 domain-containing protein n=1 Tax=Hymenobacter setariae TaxID=2594794 RepID=A0A558BPQ3_9BACT|nr:DUF1353 domain-containing protein [Hymenobacter setariae]TVT38500.1 DUF1353 domain-containing protein [Hymenobacter setariae]
MPITADPTAGVFSDTPKIDFIDTPNAPNRKVRVIDDFTFTEAANGTVWEAPSGSLVDGASIPRVLWTLVGSPFTGDYVYGSIVHDVACDTRTRPWRDTHYMFYLACLAGGTRRGRAKLMYLAVRNFGPRWPQPAPQPEPVVAEQLAFSAVARVGEPTPLFSPFVSYEAQLRYLRRAQAYLATHGDGASLEAIDIYASRPI